MQEAIAPIAEKIARQAHHGQFRRDGVRPYIVHPEAVASRVETDHQKAVAWLHDVLEDTATTAEDLRAAAIPENIIEAVQLLTKSPNIPYADYLAKVRANELAKAVKVADMLSNLADTPTEKQILKYAKGLQILLA